MDRKMNRRDAQPAVSEEDGEKGRKMGGREEGR